MKHIAKMDPIQFQSMAKDTVFELHCLWPTLIKTVSKVTTYTVHMFDLVVHILQFLLKVVASAVAAHVGFLLSGFCLVNNCITLCNTLFKISNHLLLSFAQLRIPDLHNNITVFLNP